MILKSNYTLIQREFDPRPILTKLHSLIQTQGCFVKKNSSRRRRIFLMSLPHLMPGQSTHLSSSFLSQIISWSQMLVKMSPMILFIFCKSHESSSWACFRISHVGLGGWSLTVTAVSASLGKAQATWTNVFTWGKSPSRGSSWFPSFVDSLKPWTPCWLVLAPFKISSYRTNLSGLSQITVYC